VLYLQEIMGNLVVLWLKAGGQSVTKRECGNGVVVAGGAILRVASGCRVAEGHNDKRVGLEPVHCGNRTCADESDAEEFGDIGGLGGGEWIGDRVGCRR
jgi:hypothetical protein